MKNRELTSEGLHITEGLGGVYSYYLSDVGTNARSLCGAQTMNTQLSMASWGAAATSMRSGVRSVRRWVLTHYAALAYSSHPTDPENNEIGSRQM